MSALSELRQRVEGWTRLCRLTPFDVATTQGRSDERHRRVLLSAVATTAARAVAVVATLISIPIALRYLGPERFGIWSTLSALLITLQFADLGIGNSIVTAVSKAQGSGNLQALKGYVSGGACAMLAIGCIILALLLFVVPVVPWVDLFKLKSQVAIGEIVPAMICFSACIGLAVPLGLVHRVQIGLQMGFMASAWQIVANLFSLAAIWAAAHFGLGLPWFVVALLGGPLVAAAANSITFFWRVQPGIRPAIADVKGRVVKELMRVGSAFLVLQIAMSIVFASDTLIIANVLGASEVAQFAVPEKMFSLVAMMVTTAMSPLWPAYSEAIAQGDRNWVKQTLKRSLMLAGVFSTLSALMLVLIGPTLLHLWVGDSIGVAMPLLLALALWRVLEGIGYPLGMFLNGAGIIRFQVITACLMAAAVVFLKPTIVESLGVAGAPLSTALFYLVITLIPLAFLLPRAVGSLRGAEARAIC